jgi:hypothetical protein
MFHNQLISSKKKKLFELCERFPADILSKFILFTVAAEKNDAENFGFDTFFFLHTSLILHP